MASDRAPLVMLDVPASPRAEAFRVLRVRLGQSLAPRPLRSVLITSPGEHEGRHRVAANIALAFAESGVDTLVVDADLHLPLLHHLLAVQEAPGLVQCLSESLDWHTCLRLGPVTGLSVLAAGGTDDVPARLLGGKHAAGLFAEIVSECRMTVVVAPPVLPNADASLLASYFDGVVLIGAALRTGRTAMRDAKQRLEGAGANILGAVLDGVAPGTA